MSGVFMVGGFSAQGCRVLNQGYGFTMLHILRVMHACVCVCMFARMDGWMDGWMEEWMGACMYVCTYVCMYLYVRMYVCLPLSLYIHMYMLYVRHVCLYKQPSNSKYSTSFASATRVSAIKGRLEVFEGLWDASLPEVSSYLLGTVTVRLYSQYTCTLYIALNMTPGSTQAITFAHIGPDEFMYAAYQDMTEHPTEDDSSPN